MDKSSSSELFTQGYFSTVVLWPGCAGDLAPEPFIVAMYPEVQSGANFFSLPLAGVLHWGGRRLLYRDDSRRNRLRLREGGVHITRG